MIGELLTVAGASLMLLAGIGVIRFGDPLARMHALAKASTLGILLILAGAAINLADANDVTSVVLAGLLHVLSSPPTSNMVSRAVYLASGMPHEAETIDEGAEPLGLPYHDETDRRPRP
jgi:multicomponent Na+:H+ antiporter subunit G